MNSRSILLTSSVAAILAAGCQSNTKVAELETARAVVAQVEASPRAGVAAENVTEARHALDRADKASKQGRSEGEVKYEAMVAIRNAEIANQKIITDEANQTVRQGEVERQRVLAEVRGQEAANRAREAQAALSEAELARQRAAEAELQSKQLQEELRELQAKPTERGLVLTLGDVLFDTGQSTLKPGAMGTIDRLAQFLQKESDRRLLIEGHTDSVGSDEFNQQLSERRAEAVRSALLSRGIPSERVNAVGRGESVPVASNDNPGGRQQNRRVEIVIQNAQDPGRVAEER